MTARPIRDRHPGPLPDEANRLMALLLRVGLMVSLVLLIVFSILFVVDHPAADSGSLVQQNPMLSYLSLGSLAAGLASGSIIAYLTVGVFVLIATPVARVAIGSYFFERHRERSVALVTLTVLALLLFGLLYLGPLIR